MCGIIGAISKDDVVPVLLGGLKRLEYRGYDSAGLAVLDGDRQLVRHRRQGKVVHLVEEISQHPCAGSVGIAHTRWATHGAPSEANAHPHRSEGIALVHNGIIENHESLKQQLKSRGYHFVSDTDTETVVHLVHAIRKEHPDLRSTMIEVQRRLTGAYALLVLDEQSPDVLVALRMGCPMVIGFGDRATYVASDVTALLPLTQDFLYLEDHEVSELRVPDGGRSPCRIWSGAGTPVERSPKRVLLSADAAERGTFRHFMLKEIHEQPRAVTETLEQRISGEHVLESALGYQTREILPKVKAVHIVACGSSYHAGLVARHWIESLAQVPVSVEIASEYRYRPLCVQAHTLLVGISQSGETADTLAAFRRAKTLPYTGRLALCNVAESAMMREAELGLLTRAGPEIGVASTKAFMTQLTLLFWLSLGLAKSKGLLKEEVEKQAVKELRHLPALLEKLLEMDPVINEWARLLTGYDHALYVARGTHEPIAREGALKLKEIAYIQAESYPAGELKHGPLALIDSKMAVVGLVPANLLSDKLKSNLEVIRARNGHLFLLADPGLALPAGENVHVLRLPEVPGEFSSPIAYALPLQLLAYHVAVLRKHDVDQPRNLAKSVTVE
jgi:glucosamine--fructose-6-phosphate aminotransferase (isomerizing)